jgi:hypothetical protein
MHDSGPEHVVVHVGAVPRREVEVVEQRAVNSPSQLRGRGTIGTTFGMAHDLENVRAYAKLSVG